MKKSFIIVATLVLLGKFESAQGIGDPGANQFIESCQR